MSGGLEMDKWLSVSKVVEETKIPENTLRRYLTKHQHHLRLNKNHKQYSIHEESVEVLKKIRGWYEDNKKQEQVDDLLNQSNIPMTITVHDDGGSVVVDVAETLSELKKAMGEQKEFNKMLLHTIQEQNEYIKNSLDRRDNLLTESLRSSMNEVAAEKESEEKVKKKKWWQYFR